MERTCKDMVKIQLDLSPKEDIIVELYKVAHNLVTKVKAIKGMILFFDARVKPEKMTKKEYFRPEKKFKKTK